MENEKRDKYLDLARELKKAMKHGRDGDTVYNLCSGNDPQRLSKRPGRLEIGGQVGITQLQYC